jgi:DNA-binding LacI/PurR family transcriptional regulator
MRARMADIARHAQVSEATGSRVINDRPGVSAETRMAVLTALDVLGYERPERLLSCDDRLAGDLAVSHLVALGHRRIGLISGPNRFVNTQRKLAGYRTAMKRELGVTDDAYVSLTLFGVEGGEVAADCLLAQVSPASSAVASMAVAACRVPAR